MIWNKRKATKQKKKNWGQKENELRWVGQGRWAGGQEEPSQEKVATELREVRQSEEANGNEERSQQSNKEMVEAEA